MSKRYKFSFPNHQKCTKIQLSKIQITTIWHDILLFCAFQRKGGDIVIISAVC